MNGFVRCFKAPAKRLLPVRLRRKLRTALRMLIVIPLDLFDRLSGRRPPLVPPRTVLRSSRSGDFVSVGEAYVRYLIELGGLKATDRVLDLGCGCGRIARPLTAYLSHAGEYHGLDISFREIDWCRKNISSRFPAFHFDLADVYNETYNPKGRSLATQLRLPYADAAFDFLFLGSVFTHMLPLDVAHYFAEIRRVLKPGGRCLITYFLLNAESLDLIARGEATMRFSQREGPIMFVEKDRKEDAIAYDEDFIRELYRNNQMEIVDPIHYGRWCGRPRYTGFQDMIVAVQPLNTSSETQS
jgi:SAM-dependent methyltransferase